MILALKKCNNMRRYSGGFVEGLYCGRGTALFFDGSHYEGEWDSGLRSRWGRWVHASADHEAPEVLGKVYEAVKAVIGSCDRLEGELRGADCLSPLVSGSSHAATAAQPSTPPALAPNATGQQGHPPPPDVLSNPVPGKIGGDGALDAGQAGNPSGSAPPPSIHIHSDAPWKSVCIFSPHFFGCITRA
jgi:hypothetical protein